MSLCRPNSRYCKDLLIRSTISWFDQALLPQLCRTTGHKLSFSASHLWKGHMFTSLLFVVDLILLWTAIGEAAPTSSDSLASYHVPTGGSTEDIEGYHTVGFHAGHTLEDHFDAIGINLSDLGPDECEFFQAINSLPGYRGRFNDTMIHDYIRRDPGVEWVEQEVWVGAFTVPQTSNAYPQTPNQSDVSSQSSQSSQKETPPLQLMNAAASSSLADEKSGQLTRRKTLGPQMEEIGVQKAFWNTYAVSRDPTWSEKPLAQTPGRDFVSLTYSQAIQTH